MVVMTKPKPKRKAKPKPRTTSKNKLAPLLRKAKREGWARYVLCENDERAVLAGHFIDFRGPKRVRGFFREFLRHSKGEWAGKAFELIPWQYHTIVVPAFGWINGDTGYRLKNEIYCEIAKKNGKSTLGAGLGLYLLVADGEPGAEIYTVATKQAQAMIIHEEAVKMVKRSAHLLRWLHVHKSTKLIEYEAQGSKYQALPADAAGVEGVNPHSILADEMHVWKNRDFLDALRYATVARRQPLNFTFTTAGVHDPMSVGWGEHVAAEKWLKGDILDMQYHAVIFGNPEEADPFKTSNLKRANPSWAVTIDPAEIKRAAKAAKKNPTKRPAFIRYRANIWMGAGSPWLDMGKWDACADPIDEKELHGRECYGGIDIATKLDLTALVWIFPATKADPHIRVLPRFWVPKETATVRSKRDKLKYLEWAREGHIRLFQSEVTDFRAIMEQFKLDRKSFRIIKEGIGCDPYQAEHFRQELDPQGEYIVEYGQGYRDMTTPTKHVEELLATDVLRHNGNPVMRWCVSNVVIIDDTMGNVRPDRKRSADKIDGAMGMIMGLGRKLITDVTPPKKKVTITVVKAR